MKKQQFEDEKRFVEKMRLQNEPFQSELARRVKAKAKKMGLR